MQLLFVTLVPKYLNFLKFSNDLLAVIKSASAADVFHSVAILQTLLDLPDGLL
jgi:hypothetical protein